MTDCAYGPGAQNGAMRHLQTGLVVLAALVGVAALVLIFIGRDAPPEPVYDFRAADAPQAPEDVHSADPYVEGDEYVYTPN